MRLEMKNDLETTRPNSSKKIRNDCTKTENQDYAIFYYVSYKTDCVYACSQENLSNQG